VIDTTAGLHTVAGVIGNDPSAQAATADLLPRSREVNQAVTAALARAAPGPGSTTRAHAAYAAAKNGTLALLSATHGRLTRAARAELLAAAIRALGQPPPGQTHSHSPASPQPARRSRPDRRLLAHQARTSASR
jgi:hypothetical protein